MPRRDIKNLSFNSFHNYAVWRSGGFVDKEITCILWGLYRCDSIFHPHFHTFCFTDIAVATFSGRILQRGYPITLKVLSNLAQVNWIILPLGMIRMNFWKSLLVRAVGGENVIRLRCISVMFMLRVVQCGRRREWQSELGMPWDILPSPGCLCAAFIFWTRKRKIHLRCKSWCIPMQGVTGVLTKLRLKLVSCLWSQPGAGSLAAREVLGFSLAKCSS